MPKPTIKEAIFAVFLREGRPMSVKELYTKIIEYDYYWFRAERPVGIVATEVRRHCKGVEFPSASDDKYYQILVDGTYWLIDASVPNQLIDHLIVNDSEKSTEISVDHLKEGHKRYTEHFKKIVLDQLKNIEPRDFESFSKKLLEVYGFKDVKVTQYTKDGGIDGYGKLKVGITYLSVAFQCKRWKNTTIRKKEVQSFRGDIQGRFEQGIFFTTSTYTKDAKEASIQKGAVPIILIDGNTMVEIMIEKKFGIEIDSLPIYINALDRALTEDL